MQNEINKIVIARLKDPTQGLYPSLVTGGIWNRKLSKEDEGGTPSAFAPYEGDPLMIDRVRNSIVVFGPNEVDPTDGPINTEDIVLRMGFVRVYYYVPATDDGKDDYDEMDKLARKSLGGYQFMLSTGYPVTFKALEAVELIDSDEWAYTKEGQRRFHCEWLRPADM